MRQPEGQIVPEIVGWDEAAYLLPACHEGHRHRSCIDVFGECVELRYCGQRCRSQRCPQAAMITRPIATDTSIVARLARHHRRARTVSHSPAAIAVLPAGVRRGYQPRIPASVSLTSSTRLRPTQFSINSLTSNCYSCRNCNFRAHQVLERSRPHS